MTSHVIKRSALLKGGHVDRLDAEFFYQSHRDLEEALFAAGGALLGDVCELSDKRVADPRKAAVTPSATFQYIEIADIDIRDGFVLFEPTLYAEASPRARMALAEGQVALSSVRPIRNAVCLVTEDLSQAVGSTGLIVLTPTAIDPDVLFLVLKAESVIRQLDRRSRASMYPTLYPPDVLDVRLPPLPAALVSELKATMKDARAARVRFLTENALAQKAADSFFGTMGPDKLLANLAVTSTKTVKRAEVMKDVRRMDAEFHDEAFADAQARMRAVVKDVVPLGGLAARIDTGRTPAATEYSSEDIGGAAVVKVATLTNLGINWPGIEFAGNQFLGYEKSSLLEGDLLFTSSAHAPFHIGRKVDVVRNIPAGLVNRMTFAGEVMRVRIDDTRVSPEYVAAFLRNPLGGEQIRRTTRGITSHVYPDDIGRHVLVPIPPHQVLEKIDRLYISARLERWNYREAVTKGVIAVNQYVNEVLGT